MWPPLIVEEFRSKSKRVNLPNLEELSFLKVLALPKASSRGFDATMRSAIVGPVDCVVPLSLASRADWRFDTTAR